MMIPTAGFRLLVFDSAALECDGPMAAIIGPVRPNFNYEMDYAWEG
jgi:hypothetical protein